MSGRSVGSEIQLLYEVRFLTFTPDQFNQVLKGKGFSPAPTQVTGPQGQTVPVQLFSKGNLMVFFVQNPNQIQVVFKALNTVSLASALTGGLSPSQDIMEILMGLNILPDAISRAQFTCTTRASSKTDPLTGLTAGMKPEFLEAITKALGTPSKSLNATLLRFGTVFPLRDKNGTELILQPLLSDPNAYQMTIHFQTNDMTEFDRFIGGFGDQVVKSTMEAIESV